MKNYLILYSTTDGQTKKICNVIISKINKEKSFDFFSLEEAFDVDIEKYDKIILGASIRYGKHKKNIFEFIDKNVQILNKKSTAFFTVNVVARKVNKDKPDTNPYMIKFLNSSGWIPNYLAVFAGKVDYPNYRFFDKQIIRLIMHITKGPTDISKSYEFTDWKKVESFALKIL